MKWLVPILLFITPFAFSQDYDFQELCITCAEAEGYYCGDDPANWTQYSPDGCVPNYWLNDGWEDCVDASDENGAVPTTAADCAPPVEPCDTVYVDIPVIEYVYITDTITVIEYETILDTIVEYVPEYIVEYIDCETGLPCNTSIAEILKESQGSTLLYNLQGQIIGQPQGVYIENGKVKLQWHK